MNECDELAGVEWLYVVTVPPKIERQDTAFSVVEEREVILPCRVSGVPTPVVRWTRENVTVASDGVRYRVLRSHWLAIPIVRLRNIAFRGK